MKRKLFAFWLLSLFVSNAEAVELQPFFGPLLSNTEGVEDTIPLGGIRLTTPLDRNAIEYTLATGAGRGVSYQILAVDYRVVWEFSHWSLAGALGINFDSYTPKDSSGSTERKMGNGFHFAGAFIIPMAETLYWRADFQQRFGPGRSLWVMVGPALHF